MTLMQKLTSLWPIFVRGPGGRAALTVWLRLRASPAELTAVLAQLSSALHAQCITFEVQAVADEGLEMLELEWDTIFASSDADWIGFFGFPEGVTTDPYEFIEYFHQEREAAVYG